MLGILSCKRCCQQIMMGPYKMKSLLIIYWQDGLEDIKQLFSNPIFTPCMNFNPYHKYERTSDDTSQKCVYGKFMSADHAWEIQVRSDPQFLFSFTQCTHVFLECLLWSCLLYFAACILFSTLDLCNPVFSCTPNPWSWPQSPLAPLNLMLNHCLTNVVTLHKFLPWEDFASLDGMECVT